jgi:hypothetical protein
MQKLKTTEDNRITKDADNGAVRSFFGTDLVDAPASTAEAAEAKAVSDADATQAFLEENKDAFKLEGVSLTPVAERKGSATSAVTYLQEQNGVPVYGAKIVVGLEQASKRIASAVNNVDYAIPAELSAAAATVAREDVAGLVRQHLSPISEEVKTGVPTLYIYRCVAPPTPETESANMQAKIARVQSLGEGTPGEVYLAWQVPADTTNPSGNWEVFVDARTGGLIQVKDRRRYAASKGLVFMPDPITSSGDPTLSSATPRVALDPERREVDIDNLDPPNGANIFKLNGRWVVTRDIEAPIFDVPSGPHFKFSAADRRFLSVMAYFWLDRLIAYLQTFGVTTFNTAVDARKISVDAQGLNGDDNSHFTTDLNGEPFVAFGEGGVPDAADAHVVVHEYGHALHFYMGSDQNRNGSEEGFGDFLGAAWLDRFNTRQFQREATFPWDNNEGDRYSNERFLNTVRKFNDANFNNLPIHTKGSVLAATLWELFLALGGNSATPADHIAAADLVVHLYLEMLVSLADESAYLEIGRGLVQADAVLNGGANAVAIKKAFSDRGLNL